jgi:hypothetical protein
MDIKSIALSVSVLMLTACGSDSGGSGSGATSTSPINSANIFTNEPYDSSELSVDPATGQSIVRTRLSILFKATATPEQVNALLTRINATITAAIAGARSMGIRIPDPVTVHALDVIIADIKSEAFVEAVMKVVHIHPTALPDNIIETNTDDLKIIDNQLAIGGPAAWNAKAAIVTAPNIIIMDWWGDGTSQLNSFLDATLTGVWFSGAPGASDHGYHVAGILNGSYGGGSSTAALVTGIFPGHANLHLIDQSYSIPGFDAEVRAIMMAAPIGGTVIMSTSLGHDCYNTTTTGSCIETANAMEKAITWINMVRAAGMETKIFHATAAGNRAAPRYEARDTETQHPYSTSATMANIATIDGVQIPALTNTVAVENLSGTGYPRRVECLDENSFIGGNISAIGTDVTSLSYTGTASYSGSSMATPQVAGLAAYLLAIDPSLSPQKIKEILLNTAQAVPTAGGVNCSDAIAAPAIDAYAAVLALDKSSALSGSPGNAPVRNAILDISSNGTNIDNDGNGQFDEYDLMYFIQELEVGSQEKQLGTANVKYSRADLNGDGFDGGSDGYKKKFNLNIDYPPTFTLVTQSIEGELREFDEASLSDDEILCYYAYSSLYTGSTAMRTDLLANRCQGPSTIAIYYSHSNQVTFPPAFLDGCGNTDDDVSDQRETYSTRPGYLKPFDPIPERPSSQFWRPGDSNVDQIVLNENSIRRSYDPGGVSNNCDIQLDYHSVSAVNSTIELAQSGDTVNVDLSATSTSECLERPLADPGSDWSCSGALTRSSFCVAYDLKISAATSLNLNLNLSCTGPGLRYPGDTAPGSEVGFSITRLNTAGERIPTNWGSGGIVIPLPVECYDDSPTVNIQQPITFNAPENPGDVERIIIHVNGEVGAFGNIGNTNIYDPTPTLGELTNSSTMQGTVQLVPAN